MVWNPSTATPSHRGMAQALVLAGLQPHKEVPGITDLLAHNCSASRSSKSIRMYIFCSCMMPTMALSFSSR